MPSDMKLENRWVVVTGASSGLGKEIAIQLASRYQANTILLARRTEKLKELKQHIEQTFHRECITLSADLSNESNYEAVFEQLSKLDISAVILNAGVTHFGEDIHHDWREFQAMLHTNVSSVVYFTRAFVHYFEQRKIAGGILVVGSMAGLTPVPYQGVYSGTKAFLTHYCQALQQEISRSDVSLSLFAPGGIDTEMNHASGLALSFSDSVFLQSVETCASDALETLIKRKNIFVPQLLNRLQVFLVKLLPRNLVNRFTASTYRKALKKKQSV